MARHQLEEAEEAALGEALRELGAAVVERSWGVGGAVEETVYDVDLPAGALTLVLRSYEGPLLSGDAAAVDAVVSAVRRRLARG
jgi:hypothetical protein